MLRNWWLLLLPAAIIIAAGYVLFHYHAEMYAGLMLSLLYIRGFGIRYGARRIGYLLLMAFLPILWRRSLRAKIEKIQEMTDGCKAYCLALPRWMHVCAAIPIFVCAVLAMLTFGGVLRVLAIGPLRFSAQVLFGDYFLLFVKYLGRMAFARGLEKLFPSIMGCIPIKWRIAITKSYFALWHKTTRKFNSAGRQLFASRPEKIFDKIEEKRKTHKI